MIALLMLVLQQQTVAPPVRIAVTVRPDTVTVGTRVVVIVRAEVPARASLAFPPGPDTGQVGVLARQVAPAAPIGAGWVRQSAAYRVAAWDVGLLKIQLGDLVVHDGPVERHVPLEGVLFVRSVLPADSAKRAPKPARPLLPMPDFRWLWWLLAAMAALLLAWWLWRRYRRWRNRPVDPYVAAERELDRLAAAGYLERDEGARYVTLVADVMRIYLAARLEFLDLSQATGELLGAMRATPPGERARAGGVLAEADLAKFARRSVPVDVARSVATEVRTLVREVEARLRAEAEAKEKAA